MVNAYFNNDIKPEIISAIRSAAQSIKVCVAWLTDSDIMSALYERQSHGIDVEIIVMADPQNLIDYPNKKLGVDDIEFLTNYKVNLSGFVDIGGKLVTLHKTIKFIHHKFAIIDSSKVITGSYNWSHGALQNRENIVIVNSADVAKKYDDEFRAVSELKYEHLLLSYFPLCSICSWPSAKVKVIDHRNSTRYDQFNTYILNVCTNHPDKHYDSLTDSTEIDHIDEIANLEHEAFHAENQGKDNVTKLFDRHVKQMILSTMGSEQHIFLNNSDQTIFGLYTIEKDEEYNKLSIVWENVLIQKYNIPAFYNELIYFIDKN